ncbi:ion channel [Aeribacillus composti]|uniref:ion channel n=1 Tax=Aeribacillus composti TaxID=1868734 RepID=UPI002E24AE8B|nr:ion channel [Aeribacillus composti]
MAIVVGTGIMFCLVMSIRTMFSAVKRGTFLTFETVYLISLVYASFLLGFGVIYLILTQYGFPILAESGRPLYGTYLENLTTCLYFSAVTLFSVGYGDITPFGIGRWIAIVQAMIGYILPTVVVAKTMIDIEKKQ